MPYDEPAASDPTMLVGVSLPAEPDSLREMAYAFAGEFAFMGHDADYIMRMFRRPFYRGAHEAYRGLGEAEAMRIVDECVNVYGRVRFVVRDAAAHSGEK